MLTFTADRLTRVSVTIFRAAGTPDDIAFQLAGALVGANLAGHDSHGVIHVPGYVDRIRSGDIRPQARPEIEHEGAAIVRVDGGWGIGHYTAHVCMQIAESTWEAIQNAARTVGASLET